MAARCDASAVDRDSAGRSVCFRAAADCGSRLEGLDIKGAAVDRDTFAAAAARFAFVAAADTGAGTKSRLDSIIAGIKNHASAGAEAAAADGSSSGFSFCSRFNITAVEVHAAAVEAFIASDGGFILIVALGKALTEGDQLAGTLLLVIYIQGVPFTDLETSPEVHRRAVAEDDMHLAVGVDALFEGNIAIDIIPAAALQGAAVGDRGHADIPLVRRADALFCDDLLTVP